METLEPNEDNDPLASFRYKKGGHVLPRPPKMDINSHRRAYVMNAPLNMRQVEELENEEIFISDMAP